MARIWGALPLFDTVIPALSTRHYKAEYGVNVALNRTELDWSQGEATLRSDPQLQEWASSVGESASVAGLCVSVKHLSRHQNIYLILDTFLLYQIQKNSFSNWRSADVP